MTENINNQIDNREPYYFRDFLAEYVDLLLLKVMHEDMSFGEYIRKVCDLCDFFENDPKAISEHGDGYEDKRSHTHFYRCTAEQRYIEA